MRRPCAHVFFIISRWTFEQMGLRRESSRSESEQLQDWTLLFGNTVPAVGELCLPRRYIFGKPEANSSFSSIMRFFFPSKTINAQLFQVRKHHLETSSRKGVFQAQTRPGEGLIKLQKGQAGQTGVISDLSVILAARANQIGWGRLHTVPRQGVGRG